MRQQLVNSELFYGPKEARILTERWRIHYNTVPHTVVAGVSHPSPKTSGLRVEGYL
jgi:putative transposase